MTEFHTLCSSQVKTISMAKYAPAYKICTHTQKKNNSICGKIIQKLRPENLFVTYWNYLVWKL